MDSSSNKPDRSSKYYRTDEEFLMALNSALAKYGITANQKAEENIATKGKENTYEVRFFRKDDNEESPSFFCVHECSLLHRSVVSGNGS